jgi:hypothetical protein
MSAGKMRLSQRFGAPSHPKEEVMADRQKNGSGGGAKRVQVDVAPAKPYSQVSRKEKLGGKKGTGK